MVNKFGYLVVSIVLILLAGTAGYLVGQGRAPKLASIGSSIPVAQTTPTYSKLFQVQTAAVAGKITSVSASSINVTDDKNQTDSFSLAKKWVVYKTTVLNQQASASSNLKDIETNKTALITLQLINGNYQVTSISYPSPLPSNAPLPTPQTQK